VTGGGGKHACFLVEDKTGGVESNIVSTHEVLESQGESLQVRVTTMGLEEIEVGGQE